MRCPGKYNYSLNHQGTFKAVKQRLPWWSEDIAMGDLTQAIYYLQANEPY